MPLNDDQVRRMKLGGTQLLPAPLPGPATIRFEDEAKKLVEIHCERSDSQAVIWLVDLQNINVVKKIDDCDPDDIKESWLVGDEIGEALKGNQSLRGLGYVKESAQVLLRMEHGTSAEDSIRIVAAGLLVEDREADEDFEIKCSSC